MCRHIDYSGLEETKGDTNVIRRYFADEEAGCDVVEEEEEGHEEAVGIYFVYFNFVKLSQTSKDHESSSEKRNLQILLI